MGAGRERGNEGGWGGDGGGWGGQQSCVFVVHNLPDQFNCDRLFNLVCLYGNVSKIFFMKKKEGTAMVEMGDPEAVQRVVSNLNRAEIWGSRLRTPAASTRRKSSRRGWQDLLAEWLC